MAGFLGDLGDTAAMAQVANRMANAIAHRGPDDAGVWVDAREGYAVGHRRLSVIDTTRAGRQPMVSSTGGMVVSFNGEIYNYRQLRTELEKCGVTFRTSTDTEVLLEACALWGVEAAAKRLVGMFVFAIWDIRNGELKLARDRLGIKPLYWTKFDSGLAFGSELRALRQHPGVPFRVDRSALAMFLRRNCVPAPFSIFEGVHKLEAGCILTYKSAGVPVIRSFWSLEGAIRAAQEDPLTDISDSEGLSLIQGQLLEAVSDRTVADVPLGAFLSGGVDSSAVVALLQDQSRRPVRTFSLGFTEADHDEAPMARNVAIHLGTKHTEHYVSPAEVLDVIPNLPTMFDEPFADSSQIPTYLVCALAREQVTVAMSGDGGDETFAGYNRHKIAGSSLARLFDLPLSLRRGMRRAMLAISTDQWRWASRHGPRRFRNRRMAEDIHKLAGVLEARDTAHFHNLLTTHWRDPGAVMIRPGEGALDEATHRDLTWLTDPLELMLYLDSIDYLPDDILTKVDRASMSVALEVRVPLIDHRLVELMWRLPMRFRIRDGTTKWALRQILYRHVPEGLIDRPKQGFALPIGAWLRGPLREWAEALLAPSRLAQEGFFAPSAIQALWQQHLNGLGAWEHHLWDVLMFQAWLERQPRRDSH